jgi:hypothetical protein
VPSQSLDCSGDGALAHQLDLAKLQQMWRNMADVNVQLAASAPAL